MKKWHKELRRMRDEGAGEKVRKREMWKKLRKEGASPK